MRCLVSSVIMVALASCLLACASQQKPTPAVADSRSAVPGGTRVGQPAVSADDVTGTWVEFWSLSGHCETQRYTFLQDGRFGWRAPHDADARVTRRWGQWKLEHHGAAGSELVLLVQGHEERFGCEGSATCRVAHERPEQDRLPIGECPPNEEAKALDPSYRCLGIGPQIFWRHHDDEAESALLTR